MRRSPAVLAVPLALVVLVAIVLGGIAVAGGGDNDTTTNPAPRDSVEAPTEATPPPGDPDSLPPEFVKCMADQGFAVESPTDIHSAPPQVLQTCFGTLHQGGGTP
jgi:hypothetical protein